nr:MAG TPA: hypothetical protein [Caudoviricetes sp.]
MICAFCLRTCITRFYTYKDRIIWKAKVILAFMICVNF